jgi:hypothetical protein
MLLMLASQATGTRPEHRPEILYGDLLRHRLVLLPDLQFQFLDALPILAALRPPGTIHAKAAFRKSCSCQGETRSAPLRLVADGGYRVFSI